MDLLLVSYYLIYLLIVILVILRVGHILHDSGIVYLKRMLSQHPALARKVNDLLLLGYYLVNIGYSVSILASGNENLHQVTDLLELLTSKLGFILLLLGILHFLNMTVIYFAHLNYENSIEKP